MPSAHRLLPLLVMPLAAFLGTAQADGQQTHSDTAKVFTPATYAVADFYRNTSYRGASWSADHRRLLISSNGTGIWNAYAIPLGGGPEQALTRSTTNSVF